MVWATAIFSEIFGVVSSVTLEKVLTSVLPSSSLLLVRWSVASTRMLRTIVSDTLSGGPLPPPGTVWVSTRSTRSRNGRWTFSRGVGCSKPST